MMASHCESALQRIQRIVSTASRPNAPITQHEAYEQIIEELELAGFGAPYLDESISASAEAAHLH